MRIEIRLNEICNFNCPYCKDLHNNNIPIVKLELENYEKLFKQFDKLEFFIFGGEPTLHPDIVKFVSLCKKYSDRIIIQTNGSNPDVIKKLINEYSGIIINYSYHPSNTTLSEFIKNIKANNMSTLGEIAVMDMPRKNIKEYKKLKMLFTNNVQYYPILPKTLDKLPSSEHLRSLENDPDFDLIKNDWAFTKLHHGYSNYEIWRDNILSYGKLCTIEFHSMFIQNNLIYKCFSDIFNDTAGIPLENYTYQPTNKICHNQNCWFDSMFWDSSQNINKLKETEF